MADIDWAALLEGKEPQPIDEESEELSGLISVNSDISLTGSTQSTRDSYRNISVRDKTNDRLHEYSDSGSFLNLQSVNDLLQGHSPSPDLHGTRSATSIKSNVTFSESEPEVFNIAEELNLMSIGDLLPDEEVEGEESAHYSSDKFTEEYSESEYNAATGASNIEEEGRYTDEVEEEEEKEEEEEISEDIKTKSDGWKNVKDKMLNKGKKIPVFMVGPKKKKLQKDLSFSRSMDKSEISQVLSRKSSKSSLKSEPTSRKSSVVSEKSVPVSYNFTSFTEDFTTMSDSSEVTTSRKSVTEIRFEQPCCKCECKNQTADVNMRPVPLFSGLTLDSKTLEELSAMNPDKIALLNMMKAQYNLTKSLIGITSSILNSEVDTCKPTVRYTNFEDTKRYIAKHQPYKKNHNVRSEKSKSGRRSAKSEKRRRKPEKPES